MYSSQVAQPLKLTFSTITRPGWRKHAPFSAGETTDEKGVCSRRLGRVKSQIAVGLLYNLLIILKVELFPIFRRLCSFAFIDFN